MKNRFLLFFFSIAFSTGLFAQEGFSSLSEATDMAKEIVNAAGLRQNFIVREGRVPNAVAVLTQGKRYIFYNPNFIEQLTRATGTKWSAVSVLAHEIGHHLYSQWTGGRNTQLATELQADEFSGFVLKKMGASLSEAQAAMKVLASVRASRTHPARDDRLTSIAKGWGYDGEIETEDEPAVVLADKYILADIRVESDPHSQYYVTTQYNVVKIKDNKLYKVARLSKSGSSSFPYLIYDEKGTRVYVDSYGAIVDRTGDKVGSLRLHK
jgi:hypothetical protein